MLGHLGMPALDSPLEFESQMSPRHAQDISVSPQSLTAAATTEDVSLSSIHNFVREICTIVPASVINTPAARRRAKVPTTDDGLPWCSAHIAAQGKLRDSNLEVQA
jgi:hypothetical protein